MSDFVQSMDKIQENIDKHGETENGDTNFNSTGEKLLDFFFKLVRDLSPLEIEKAIADILEGANPSVLADLFVLLMQTRDVRGGKGERELFLVFFKTLYNSFPETCLSLLKLIPEYGCYRDLKNLYASLEESDEAIENLKSAIVDLFSGQLFKDSENHMSFLMTRKFKDGISPSNAAKWVPKEGRTEKHKELYVALVKKMYPDSSTPNKDYRQLVTELNAFLDVPEVKMCANKFADIKLQSVSSLAMAKYKRAFLNKLKDGTPLTEDQLVTGNRFPDDPDRVQCRENLLQLLTNPSGKIKGKDLYPHEIIKSFLNRQATDEEDVLVSTAQWQAMKESVIQGIKSLNEVPQEGAINLGKLIPLCDVSGSMNGIPMDVCIALGILISELAEGAFSDRILTFETKPQWVNLSECKNLKEKVEALIKAPWGGSTAIDKAFDRILEVIEENNLLQEAIPDLIIFSDMQFDEADECLRNKDVLHERLVKKFHTVGMKVCGKPYDVPRIIYWNLRGDTPGFPVESSTLNTQLLSGYSPSLFKLILDGEPLEIEEVSESGEVVKRKVTPLETLRKCLDDTRYDDVRVILSESTEGLLREYSFTPAERIDEPVEETD